MSLPPPEMTSARPGITAALMAETGLSETILRRLVDRFYEGARADDLLGPIFAGHIDDWPRHLDRMVDFWSSVALMTGRYHGAPIPAHAGLPLAGAQFDRWLALFRATADAVCPPEGAALLTDRAERIARALRLAAEAASLRQPEESAG